MSTPVIRRAPSVLLSFGLVTLGLACGSATNDAASSASAPGGTCATCDADAATPSSDAHVSDDASPSSSATVDAAVAPPSVLSGDADLCGPQAYAGTLIIAKGTHVTCATGDLSIHADAIVIESGASVSVAPTSTRAGGIDARACSLGSYTSYSGASGAGHGSFGEGGGTGYDVNSGANGYPACHDCAAPIGGSVFGSPDDLVIEPGAQGGDGCEGGGPTCPSGNVLAGGRGGGTLALTATTSIRIDGELHADGEAGEHYATSFTGGSGGAGGGSGGGILLRAKTVDIGVTGVVSAAGGSGSAGWNYGPCTSGQALGPFNSKGGAGGKGRVKIGAAQGTPPYNTPGTIVGVFTIAPYP